MRITYRTVTVLAVIAAQSGLSNVEVGKRAGIKDQGQISKLLTRLTALELIENIGSGGPGSAKAWRLTERGEALERATSDKQLTLGPRAAATEPVNGAIAVTVRETSSTVVL